MITKYYQGPKARRAIGYSSYNPGPTRATLSWRKVSLVARFRNPEQSCGTPGRTGGWGGSREEEGEETKRVQEGRMWRGCWALPWGWIQLRSSWICRHFEYFLGDSGREGVCVRCEFGWDQQEAGDCDVESVIRIILLSIFRIWGINVSGI